jgi:hypothetical protein
MSRNNVITMARPNSRFAFEGEYVEQPDIRDAEAIVACAMIASSIPMTPPREWFTNPHLTGPSAINVDDDGRVFGHIAAWHVSHIGLPFNTKPPHSRNDYAYFNKGVLRCEDGKDVTVGQLTLAGGHAELEMSASDAVRHYDDTDSAVADVHAGEDRYGIWVAGALRPGITPLQVRALRASTPSGDWRPIRGRLELVAVLQVNVPGFPVTRTMVASGQVTALVAAGAAAIAQLRRPSIDERLERIERALTQNAPERTGPGIVIDVSADWSEKAKALSARVHHKPVDPDLAALAAAARARVQEVLEEDSEAALFADYSTEKREEYARKGWAMPDGSYPIANVSDLRNAIKAYGRANPADKPKVRRLIMRRARGLGKAGLIPEKWLSVSIEERHADAVSSFYEVQRTTAVVKHDELSARVAALRYRPRPDHEFEPELHPRDDAGKFRDVLLRLKKDVEGQPGAEQAIQEIEAAQASNDADHDRETEDHIQNIIKIVDQVAQGNVDPNTAKTLRDGYRDLGRFVSDIELPAGTDTDKFRYTDLPEPVQATIDDLLMRLKSYVDQETYDDATEALMDFKRGGDVWNNSELMGSLAGILRFLLGTGNKPLDENAADKDKDKDQSDDS